MNEPIITGDPHSENPSAVATPWEAARRVLEAADLFWITTVRADGRPHVTPLVAVWYEGALYFTTTDDGQKSVNLRGNPHVVLTTGCSTREEGLDVVVEGDAVRVTDQDTLKRVAAVWATKWGGGVWGYQVRDSTFCLYADDGRVLAASNFVFSVKLSKAFAYLRGRSQTRYQW